MTEFEEKVSSSCSLTSLTSSLVRTFRSSCWLVMLMSSGWADTRFFSKESLVELRSFMRSWLFLTSTSFLAVGECLAAGERCLLTLMGLPPGWFCAEWASPFWPTALCKARVAAGRRTRTERSSSPPPSASPA